MEPTAPISRLTARDASKLRALAYFLTFRTYGTWLHGDQRGSVSTGRQRVGMPRHLPNDAWMQEEADRMAQPPMILNEAQRAACQKAMIEGCLHREWKLRAVNVRSNHVHVVVSANALPERVMTDLKAYATRQLRTDGLVDASRRVWARHGSTHLLYTPDRVWRAYVYTVERQGVQLGHAPSEQ